MVSDKQEQEILEKAYLIRKHIVEMTNRAKSGHPGGSLSIAEIMATLYFNWLNIDPKSPKKDDRDYFVLSKGHAAPAAYAAMAMKGFFPEEELKTLRQLGTRLQGHPDMRRLPGIEVSTGSLGQGLSVMVGMCLALKLDKRPNRVVGILGDGECQEGQVWEAAMAAAHYDCDNLTIFVDKNELQIDGATKDVMDIDPIELKFAAFGWEVIEIDAHNVKEIVKSLKEADKVKNKPVCIIAKTIKGKGVSFMEHQLAFHGAACSDDQLVEARCELDEKLGLIRCQI